MESDAYNAREEGDSELRGDDKLDPRGGQQLLAHARLFSLKRTLSVRILTDVNVGAIGFSGHSRH